MQKSALFTDIPSALERQSVGAQVSEILSDPPLGSPNQAPSVQAELKQQASADELLRVAVEGITQANALPSKSFPVQGHCATFIARLKSDHGEIIPNNRDVSVIQSKDIFSDHQRAFKGA